MLPSGKSAILLTLNVKRVIYMEYSCCIDCALEGLDATVQWSSMKGIESEKVLYWTKRLGDFSRPHDINACIICPWKMWDNGE